MYDPAKPFKHEILKRIEGTWNTPYLTVRRGIYPTFHKKFSYPEVDHTDGIGTKGFYHWKAGTFHAAVIDALAMNLNDLALVGATPYKLSNHITVPKEDRRTLTVLSALVSECRKRRIAIVGGENSFHNTLDGLDLSITLSGFIKKSVPHTFRAGDVLIGFKSSGLHSNGFTTVRRVFGSRLRPEFTVPTAIYLDQVLTLLTKVPIHGMMHMTGGAFSKLNDLLEETEAHIEHPRALRPQKIFFDLYRRGCSNKEMYTTFNCGIGFIIAVSPKDTRAVLASVPRSAIIGSVRKGRGRVFITSAFDGKVLAV